MSEQGSAGREVFKVLVFAMAVIGAIAAVVAGGFVLVMLWAFQFGGQWG